MRAFSAPSSRDCVALGRCLELRSCAAEESTSPHGAHDSHDSRLMTHASRLTPHGSRLMAHGPWLMAHGS
eukprot:scaffold65697_cov48-Phaeocystis_antarctica.AAC.2